MKSKQHATSMANMQGMMDWDVRISSNGNKYIYKQQDQKPQRLMVSQPTIQQ